LLRRHLNGEQKRDAIGKLLLENPERSDRDIGREIGVDGKTVAEKRRQMESRAEIPHAARRKDKDGRSQLAHKSSRRRPQGSNKHAPTGAGVESASSSTTTNMSKEKEPTPTAGTPEATEPPVGDTGGSTEPPTTSESRAAPTGNGEIKEELSAKSPLFLKTWRAADEAVKVEITQAEDINVMLGRMSAAQKEKLFDRLFALQLKQANVATSKSVDDMLKSITGTFWHMASQDDPQKIFEALSVINGKLATRGLGAKDLKFVAVKPKRAISPAAVAAAKAAQQPIRSNWNR
jgi:hypothetical protein